jgi:hypothetical protein
VTEFIGGSLEDKGVTEILGACSFLDVFALAKY